MTEKLEIHEFGPIKQADIEVRDLTVFVGPQATGKSMAAQLLCFLRAPDLSPQIPERMRLRRDGTRLTEETTPYLEAEPASVGPTLSALGWWLGNDVDTYARSNTIVRWTPPGETKMAPREIDWRKGAPTINEGLAQGLVGPQWRDPAAEMYVPAGRALFSFVPPATALRMIDRGSIKRGWPGYIVAFYELLADAIRERWHQQERGGDTRSLFCRVSLPFLESRIASILKGKLSYGPDTVGLQVGDLHLRAETIAAGQMEVWPFWAIVRQAVDYSAEHLTHIYFEEPETHLHPGAQRAILEIIAHLVNNGFQFVLTTHSPYVLYALNNFLLARQVLDQGAPLPSGVPTEAALRPHQVAAYCFGSDGVVRDVLDAETGQIDSDELDRVAGELGADFVHLQQAMEGEA